MSPVIPIGFAPSHPTFYSLPFWRSHPGWRSTFFHLAMRRGRKIAKVAMARKLAVHLYWMWRQGLDYSQLQKLGSHAGEPGNRHGVQ